MCRFLKEHSLDTTQACEQIFGSLDDLDLGSNDVNVAQEYIKQLAELFLPGPG